MQQHTNPRKLLKYLKTSEPLRSMRHLHLNVYDDEELSFYFSLMLAVGQQPKVRVRKKNTD
ncbi:hypothetical protein NUKP16_09510 [Klebsiella quasipneumoniae]|nr:hypothetical protein NUKP16_09510 [Klebsiella quasipneumoniae]GKQ03805.1 hypothetical protein NUKP771_23840 [Klebsiella quasipneumoniae]